MQVVTSNYAWNLSHLKRRKMSKIDSNNTYSISFHHIKKETLFFVSRLKGSLNGWKLKNKNKKKLLRHKNHLVVILVSGDFLRHCLKVVHVPNAPWLKKTKPKKTLKLVNNRLISLWQPRSFSSKSSFYT